MPDFFFILLLYFFANLKTVWIFPPKLIIPFLFSSFGNILVTSLKFEYLERVIITNGKRTGSEIIYESGSRVRDVEVGPNGNIFVALEKPGRIVKLTRINDWLFCSSSKLLVQVV